MRRIKITLAYDGTDFHGWQVQPGLPTIQGSLEEILSVIEDRPVKVAGSGRTDAGVHAFAQVAAFSLENPIPVENLRKAINRQLPPAIRVLSAEETAADFHPRFDARGKTYEYRIYRGPSCPPFEWRYTHHYPFPMDVERLLALAPLLEGEHDFAAFAAADDRELATTCRTIFSSRWEVNGDRLCYRVRGSGFLKHMVRNLVGVFLEAGKGNLDADGLRKLLAPNPGQRAGPTAPAKGLFLVQVDYA
jgi:tRNA pseudouridine38-40 synthase